MFAREGFTADGEVRALSAKVGGQLVLDEATLRNPGGYALILDGADISGGLLAGEGFTAGGEVHAVRIKVKQLVLDGATLK